MNSCPDSELGIDNFITSFHDHGVLVTQGVADEWLDRDEGDTGYQEFSDDEIVSEIVAMLTLRMLFYTSNWYPGRMPLKHEMEQQEVITPEHGDFQQDGFLSK